MTHLEPGERVETDRGYRGSAPQYVKCPDGLLADPDPVVKLMAARVRSRQETVNARFKNWVILCTPYRQNFRNTKQFLVLLSCLPSFLLQ